MTDTKKVNPCGCNGFQACYYSVPIKLYVPIFLDLEVFAKKPTCHPQGEIPDGFGRDILISETELDAAPSASELENPAPEIENLEPKVESPAPVVSPATEASTPA